MALGLLRLKWKNDINCLVNGQACIAGHTSPALSGEDGGFWNQLPHALHWIATHAFIDTVSAAIDAQTIDHRGDKENLAVGS